eukprot:801571-Prorocentrum_minimum.AAC.1
MRPQRVRRRRRAANSGLRRRATSEGLEGLISGLRRGQFRGCGGVDFGAAEGFISGLERGRARVRRYGGGLRTTDRALGLPGVTPL